MISLVSAKASTGLETKQQRNYRNKTRHVSSCGLVYFS